MTRHTSHHSRNEACYEKQCDSFATDEADLNDSTKLLQKALRKGTGIPNAEFKSAIQKFALFRSVQARSDIFLIESTGGEKYAVSFRPVMLEHAFTLAIVSLLALRQNLKSQLIHLNIPVHDHLSIYGNGSDLPKTVVVLASPEDIGNHFTNYCVFVRMALEMGIHKRIVIDETHLTYTSDHCRESMAC